MRSKWKGFFIKFSKNILYGNSIIFDYWLFKKHLSIYTGQYWKSILLSHIFLRGFKIKNFVLTKLIGNIHSDKRKQKKKINKKKKNG